MNNDSLTVTGTVLKTAPQGERDKRIVIETCELGRITVFARSVKKPGNTLMAASEPFVTGKFSITPSGTAYHLVDAEVMEYFRELAKLQPEVYYGYYFLDLTDYFAREGIDGTDMLNLLYFSLKALINPKLDNTLIRRVFEIRTFTLNGVYNPEGEEASLVNILTFICYTPLNKLFTFSLESDKIKQLSHIAERTAGKNIDRKLKSLEILELIL